MASTATSPHPTLLQPTKTRLVVLYDYCARAPDDLTVCRGDWVYADLDSRVQTDPDWLWAFLPGPDKWGYMPRNFARRPTATDSSTLEPRRGYDQYMSPWSRDLRDRNTTWKHAIICQNRADGPTLVRFWHHCRFSGHLNQVVQEFVHLIICDCLVEMFHVNPILVDNYTFILSFCAIFQEIFFRQYRPW